MYQDYLIAYIYIYIYIYVCVCVFVLHSTGFIKIYTLILRLRSLWLGISLPHLELRKINLLWINRTSEAEIILLLEKCYFHRRTTEEAY